MAKYKKDREIATKESEPVLAAREQYIGPIPRPEDFAKYKAVQEDLPDRIISVFERDSEHIRNTQQQSLDASIMFDKRGQYMAFVIILVGMVATFVLAYLDKDAASAVTGVATLALIFKGTFSKKTDGK